jgi:hypothetical protein
VYFFTTLECISGPDFREYFLGPEAFGIQKLNTGDISLYEVAQNLSQMATYVAEISGYDDTCMRITQEK